MLWNYNPRLGTIKIYGKLLVTKTSILRRVRVKRMGQCICKEQGVRMLQKRYCPYISNLFLFLKVCIDRLAEHKNSMCYGRTDVQYWICDWRRQKKKADGYKWKKVKNTKLVTDSRMMMEDTPDQHYDSRVHTPKFHLMDYIVDTIKYLEHFPLYTESFLNIFVCT